MKTFMSLFCVVALSASVVQAKIWTVDNNPGNSAADFTALSTAVSSGSVQAGDTIYVVGSALNYGATVTVTKKLYIFGPGYFLAENLDQQANTAAATITSYMALNSGSEGSIVQGLTFTNSIQINTSNITIRRNRLTTAFISTNSNLSNIIIVQNYLSYNYCCAATIQIGSNNTNIIISNNYVEVTNGGGGLTVPTGATVYVTNNIFKVNTGSAVGMNAATGSFDNNIIYSGSFSASSIVPRNNITSDTTFSSEQNGNKSGRSMATVFTLSGSPDAKWQLAAGSPAIGAGLSGEDCGMYGGNSPYVIAGLPPIPTVYFMSAPISGSAAQGLPVTIKVKSHN
ncbi:MAG: hypothetical protein KDC45_02475 [Bacteroidetes bacterium]|nr:hypothetical protein [Bacteroidota bacterium]